MNTTRPIILKDHVSKSRAEKMLKESGIQIIYVDNSMIANCKTIEDEILVNHVNVTTTEKLWDDYLCPESMYD